MVLLLYVFPPPPSLIFSYLFCRHSLVLILPDLLHRRTLQKSLVPSKIARIILLKPNCLSEVRSLPTHLEMQPLLCLILLWTLRLSQRMRSVVGIDQVFYNSTGFPERDTCVWVFDCGDSAVGVEFFEGGFLEVRHVWKERLLGGAGGKELETTHVLCGVGDFEFLENYGDLPRVRACGWRC